MLGIIAGIFGRKPRPSPEEQEATRRFCEGAERYLVGRKHCIAKRWQEALECFDGAIKMGFDRDSIFGDRAICLQSLDFHLDAIEDFDKAIALEPDDCNLYFMRAISKHAVCKYKDADEDYRTAIALSKVKSARNKGYDSHAKEMGHESAAAIYEWHRLFNQTNLDLPAPVLELMKARKLIKRREKK